MTPLNDPGTAKGGEPGPLSLWPWMVATAPERTLQAIALEVCERRGVSLSELRGERRVRAIAYARHEAFAVSMRAGLFSYPQVGRFYRKDHTTVIAGALAHERRTRAKP